MKGRFVEKTIVSLLVTAGFFCAAAPCTFAERPSQSGVKGIAAADGTYIDRSLYEDASAYLNTLPLGEDILIGIDFGDEACSEVYLSTVVDTSLEIGCVNDNGFSSIIPDCGSSLYICFAEKTYYAIYPQVYSTFAEARSEADNSGGIVGYVNGTYRRLRYYSDSESSMERLIRRNKLDAKIYESKGFSVIDGYGDQILLDIDSILEIIPSQNAEISYGYNTYRGCFRLVINENGLMNVVNRVSIEDYVKGVIPYEMSSWWHQEALKAQAVCARTYAEYNRGEYSEQGFDITDDVYSQVYRGTTDANSLTDMAVDATAGEYVRYKGEICDIYYFSADGGATESGKNVFDDDKPYLMGVTDPFEQNITHSMASWSIYYTGYGLAWLLKERGHEVSFVSDIVPEYSSTGNVIAVTFCTPEGNIRLEGREAYITLGLDSCRFTAEKDGDDFAISGSGWGHNCGMSQWGAYAMADKFGYDYQDIIRFYFTGTYAA